MEYIVHLSMDNPRLALGELQAVIPDLKIKAAHGNLVIVDVPADVVITDVAKRLAYTHRICKLLVSTYSYRFADALKLVDWQKYYKNSFWVTVEKHHRTSPITTQDVARAIALKLQHPRADARTPDMHVYAYITEKHSFCGLVMFENDKEFHKRKPHLRPEHHPASIHPKLARALVNLTRVQKGSVLDPFCGVGGILVEAGLLKLYCKGSDTSAEMIEKTQKNLEHYGIHSYSLGVADATAIEETADAIVTDVPYGRATKNIADDLYVKFLQHVRNCAPIAVVVFPNTVNVDALVKETDWKLMSTYTYYLHQSLSKTIVVLER